MSRRRFNRVLTFQDVRTVQTATGKKQVPVDQFTIRARQTSLTDDYLTRYQYPVNKEVLAFTVHYLAAKRINMNQEVEYGKETYKVDRIKANDSYPNLATVYISRTRGRT